MKKTIIVIFMISSFCTYSQTDIEILKKTISTLHAIETIEYDWIGKRKDHFDKTVTIDTAHAFFDFSSKDTLVGTKFHFEESDGERVFDGKKSFSSHPEKKVVLYVNNPNKYQITNSFSMLHSIWELKTLLPILIKDERVTVTRKKDTIVNDKDCYNFEFSMIDYYIGLEAEITKKGKEPSFTFKYKTAIEKEIHLPIHFKSRNIETTLDNFKMPATRHDSIWNYDRFSIEYLRFTYKDYYGGRRNKSAKTIGQQAPYWTLPDIKGGEVSLSALKNELILLEFWFPYCKGCVDAVPDINEIHNTYGKRGLAIFGIEFTKTSDKGLADYIIEQDINYPTLYMGAKTAKEYAAFAAPTFYLLNKNKEIVYTSVGLNKEALIKAIEDNIKK